MKQNTLLPETEQLRETTGDFLAEAQLDHDEGLVRNIALLAPTSRNGYRYTREAMQNAAPLYDGRPVFIDHPEVRAAGLDPAAPGHRSVRDYAGKVLRPRFENERIRGDLHVAGPNADWLMKLIESAPSDIGMSHVVLARRGRSGEEVEHIERVVSVDIVAFPATTRSFQESVVRSQESDRLIPDSCLLTPELLQLVEHSRIPPLARTAALYQLLETLPEPQRLIELLEAYWKEAAFEQPRSCEKSGPGQNSGDLRPPFARVREALIAAIRGN